MGQAQPPFIIYAAKQLNELWTRDGIAGSRYAVGNKGWIDQELFFFWFKEHFLTHAVNRHPLLLLLNGHISHFEPATIKFVKDNNEAMSCLLPHTTHECQPLDYSFFGPLKKHWQEICHSFYQANPSYRRNWLLNTYTYNNGQQGNMRLIKSMRLTANVRLIERA